RSQHEEFSIFTSNLATALLLQQKARDVGQKVFAFPTPDHPGWKYRRARPKFRKIRFFNAPWWDDQTIIPGVEIGAEGEIVHVIEEYIRGWHVIAKIQNGSPYPGIGYVMREDVELTEMVEGEQK